MTDILTASPLMSVFLVVAFGGILGMIPFGPLRFGAAGALFVGLFVGYLAPDLGGQLALVHNLGLALFVYMVGLSAGQTFFRDFTRHVSLMCGAAVAIGVGVLATIALGRMVAMPVELQAGLYAGASTTTAALATAYQATGSMLPGVSYALSYPIGVVVGIIAVALVISRTWPERREIPSRQGQRLIARTVVVEADMALRDVPGWREQDIRASYLRRHDRVRVIGPGEELQPGDEVVIVGNETAVRTAIAAIGHEQPQHLADDRSRVDFRSFIVSRRELAGRSVAELNLVSRFGAVITRIRRGDSELLATDFQHVEIGDRVVIAYPRAEGPAIEDFFGNSEQRVTQIDTIGLGLGVALGFLVGAVNVTLPSGHVFSLGSAVGPLIVGMLLGALHRSGPVVWQLPLAVNQTIRQLGLMLFLAAIGIASGPQFAQTAFSAAGVRMIAVGAVISIAMMVCIAVAGRVIGFSVQRTVGAMAGIFGQPAIIAYAVAKDDDERIEAGYAAMFAISMILKVLLVYVIVLV
ncbi:aspartate:alanine exchanger family transporter [Trueperella sp. LYQ143]|uniref:aspartate:alanine exchanger family transporter n=1 Tax=unclassified Trueperella TaxID=2630174 RepID=UPI003982DF68